VHVMECRLHVRHHDLDGVFFFRFGFDAEMMSASAADTSDCTGEATFMIIPPGLGQFGQKFAKNAKVLGLIGGEPDATMAERVGFEPTVPLQVRRISSAVHSTTLPPLRGALGTGVGSERVGRDIAMKNG
jgi:hypothetical protein